jgi:hypothetical protein
LHQSPTCRNSPFADLAARLFQVVFEYFILTITPALDRVESAEAERDLAELLVELTTLRDNASRIIQNAREMIINEVRCATRDPRK